MSCYKTILAVFRSPDDADCLCRLACDIANRWQAHLAGFYARPGLAVHTGLRGPDLDEWLGQKRRRIEQYNSLIRTAVEQSALSSGNNWDWREMEDPTEPSGDTAAEFARCADLVIIGRLERGSSLVDPDMTLEQLMFETGRPLLVVPPNCKARQVGRRIVVAWNGTRQASRAAFDALPLLASHENEAIRLVCPPTPEHGPNQIAQGAELAETLARHDVKLEVKALPGRHSDAGAEIMAECEEFGADLLVMGAYGHSRLREYVFGGTTETILSGSTIPVLISH